MTEKTKILCPFCSKPYTKNMLDVYNGLYGCETGCEYIRFVIVCESCKRNVYIKGIFGKFSDEKEKKEYLEKVTEEDIKESLKNPEEDDWY